MMALSAPAPDPSVEDAVIVQPLAGSGLNTSYLSPHHTDINLTLWATATSTINTTINATVNTSLADSGEVPALSDSDYEIVTLTRFATYGVLGNILVVLGWLGNTMSIVVLSNRRMRSSTSYYLTSLAVYDNFILTSMLLFFNLPALEARLEALRGLYASYLLLLPVGYPLSLAAQMGSIYTCVAFTVERFIAVCRPLHAANTCTKSRAKRVVLLIFLWSLLYNVPRCFHYATEPEWNNATQQHETTVVLTSFGRNEVFQHVYIIYLQLLFMFLLPFLLILLLNAALLRAINRSRQQRQHLSTSATREHNLTVMLVAVIVVFLVCQFPTIVDNILVAIVGEERHNAVLSYQLLFTVCTCLVTVNASLNFALYCLFGKKFRLVLRHVLGFGPSVSGSSRGRDRGRNGSEGRPGGGAYRSTLYQSRTNGTPLSHTHSYDVEVSLV